MNQEPLMSSGYDALAIKGAAVVTGVISFVSFCFSIADRAPVIAGSSPLSAVVILALLAAIAFGVIWTIAEKIFSWDFGAGGGSAPDGDSGHRHPSERLPTGFAAIVLSLSLTIPLATIPVAYQRITGVKILPDSHWSAVPVMLVCGAVAHLLMYGTKATRPNGLRFKIMPVGKATPLPTALLMEAVYAAAYFILIPLPYRLIAQSNSLPLIGTLLLGRVLLPAAVFFSCMAIFIVLKYPGSLTDKSWVQVRGFFSALLIMFCLMGGMFL